MYREQEGGQQGQGTGCHDSSVLDLDRTRSAAREGRRERVTRASGAWRADGGQTVGGPFPKGRRSSGDGGASLVGAVTTCRTRATASGMATVVDGATGATAGAAQQSPTQVHGAAVSP